MRRLLAIAVPTVLLLGAPASAPAKGIVSAKICGADGCQSIARADEGLLGGGAPADPPAGPEPFVRLSIRVGVPDHVQTLRLHFLPRSELLLGDDGGTWMVPMARAELRAIAARVTPFAASELPESVSLATKGGAGEPLAPEIAGAVEPAGGARDDDGSHAWWLVVAAAAIALAAGVALARRRRRDPPARAARAVR